MIRVKLVLRFYSKCQNQGSSNRSAVVPKKGDDVINSADNVSERIKFQNLDWELVKIQKVVHLVDTKIEGTVKSFISSLIEAFYPQRQDIQIHSRLSWQGYEILSTEKLQILRDDDIIMIEWFESSSSNSKSLINAPTAVNNTIAGSKASSKKRPLSSSSSGSSSSKSSSSSDISDSESEVPVRAVKNSAAVKNTSKPILPSKKRALSSSSSSSSSNSSASSDESDSSESIDSIPKKQVGPPAKPSQPAANPKKVPVKPAVPLSAISTLVTKDNRPQSSIDVRSIWGLVKGGAAASSAKTPQTAAVSNSKSSANNQPKVQQKDSMIVQPNSNKDQSNSNRTDNNPKKKQKIAGNSQESSVVQKESSEVNLDSLHVVNDIRQLQIGDPLWFKLMFFDPTRLVPSTTKLIQGRVLQIDHSNDVVNPKKESSLTLQIDRQSELKVIHEILLKDVDTEDKSSSITPNKDNNQVKLLWKDLAELRTNHPVRAMNSFLSTSSALVHGGTAENDPAAMILPSLSEDEMEEGEEKNEKIEERVVNELLEMKKKKLALMSLFS